MVQITIIIFITLLVSQINTQTPGTCEAGTITNPVKQCQTILDCYATEEAYMTALASDLLVWCDKLGGVCCEGTIDDKDDQTCRDSITPVFGQESCTADDYEKCTNSRQETGDCLSHRCCPAITVLSLEHDFQPNIICNTSLPLPLTFENAYCTDDGWVQYFQKARLVNEEQPCQISADCAADDAFCVNRQSPNIRFCYSATQISSESASSSSAFWIIIGVVVAVPLVIIIMCVATFIFCVEMIFCIVVIAVVLVFLGVAGTLGASFYGGYL